MRRREPGKGGFTLIELIIVIVIIGVLSAIAAPQYVRTMENSKAEMGATLLKRVAHANLIYNTDRYAYLGGAITNACVTETTCPAATAVCSLVTCGYLAKQNFDKEPYVVFAGTYNGSTYTCGDAGIAGMTGIACARRRTTGTGGTSKSPYTGWGYNVDKNAVATANPSSGGPPPPTQ